MAVQEKKKKGRPDDSYLRRIRESENFLDPDRRRFDEGPPVKRGAGISLSDLLRIVRMFAGELKKAIRRRKDAKNY